MTNSVEKEVVTILERSQYDKLVQLVPGGTTFVSAATTELQAGYQLGVQAVLAVLRGEFLSGRDQ